jgi:hypothetical protein
MSVAPRAFAVLLVVISGGYLLSSVLTITQPPQEYTRQDYFLTLPSDVGMIKVDCFNFPGVFLSQYFAYRIAQTENKVLLKRDLLVCNLDYSRVNRTADVLNATIWFFNSNLNSLTEEQLHLDLTEEQISFRMAEAGNYYFYVWILRESTGWKDAFFPKPTFYVYDSPESYFAAKRAYQVSIGNTVLSSLGIFSGVVFFIAGSRGGGGEMKRRDDLSSLAIFGAVLALALLEAYYDRKRKRSPKE